MKRHDLNSILKPVLNGLNRAVFSMACSFIFKLRLLECTSKFRIKTIFIVILFVIGYISFNNYLIMFVYIKSNTMMPVPVAVNGHTINHENYLNNWFFSIFESYKTNNSTTTQSTSKSTKLLDNSIEFIDPEDINEDGLNISMKFDGNKFVILNESYFEEEKFLSSLNSPKSKRVCFIPKLSAFNSEIMQFVKKEEELKCNPKQNWVWVENGTLRVSSEAIKKHGQILCAYLPLYRGNNDFEVNEGKR